MYKSVNGKLVKYRFQKVLRVKELRNTHILETETLLVLFLDHNNETIIIQNFEAYTSIQYKNQELSFWHYSEKIPGALFWCIGAIYTTHIIRSGFDSKK